MHPLIAAFSAVVASSPSVVRPVHTYSIVARDPGTGELGVAVQSHWFSVGSVVTWAESGVGAIATQSIAEPSYGKLGLDLMRAGKSAPEALQALVIADEGKDVRQVAMIDVRGRVATHTGNRCIADAGHHVGAAYSVQANLMASPKVWPAMAKAYEEAKGDLAERMLKALEAAEAAGGDIRGRQSAALLIVSGKRSDQPWTERLFDVRVDDHAQPLAELRRLVKVQRAYLHMNRGDAALEKKDHEGALREYSAAEALMPENVEIGFWHAVGLVNAGKVDEALPIFGRTFKRAPTWRTVAQRLAKSGFLPDDPKLLERIGKQGR